MKICHWFLLLASFSLGFIACDDGEKMRNPVETLSILLNSAQLSSGATEVPLDAKFEIVFSRSLRPDDFENAFSLQPSSDLTFSYSQQSTRVSIETTLQPETDYTLLIATEPIGSEGESLLEPVAISFRTRTEGIIRSMPACTQASADCLRSTTLDGINGSGTFDFYASFPIYEEQAEWENLTSAIIMVHGLNRNADDYFEYLMSTLQSEERQDETILIAPFYKFESESTGDDFYWSDKGWRAGRSSADPARITSFSAIDQLIAQLANRDRFPVLEDILVIGQSSGGLFTHLFAGATAAPEDHPHLQFQFIVGESQYFYYADGRRVDESSDQLFVPTGCTGYDIWPFGFRSVPPDLTSISKEDYNERFAQRPVTYLLGNGTGSDGSLNTTDCSATLLGSSRFQRGQNMLTYMNLAFPEGHQHQKVIAQGISHEGSRMYQTPEFRTLLNALLE